MPKSPPKPPLSPPNRIMHATPTGLAPQLDDSVRSILDEVRSSSFSLYLVISGAGTRAVGWLFAEPGASKTISEILIPYSRNAIRNFLSAECEDYVSANTAKSLAKVAHERAKKFADADTRPIGIACTGAIKTSPPRSGADRAFTAYWDGTEGDTATLELSATQSRTEQEEQTALALVNAIANALKIPNNL